MTSVTVATLQLRAIPGEPEQNVARLLAAIRTWGPGADLVVAPELATTGYDLALIERHGEDLAEPMDGEVGRAIRGVAEEVGVTVVVGMLERADGLLYDTAVVATPSGEAHAFRKTHLYPAELARFAPGDALVAIDTPAGRLGPLICFEHAFPELATTLALAGAQILVIPSAVPMGYEHLLTLRTRARAQDNQIFAVASNLTGGGFCGRSLIVDPRGEVLAEAGPGEQVLRASLDLTSIEREREREPALRMRRPELYDAGLVIRPSMAGAELGPGHDAANRH